MDYFAKWRKRNTNITPRSLIFGWNVDIKSCLRVLMTRYGHQTIKFISVLLTVFYRYFDITRLKISNKSITPECDGSFERFNRTVLHNLSLFVTENMIGWPLIYIFTEVYCCLQASVAWKKWENVSEMLYDGTHRLSFHFSCLPSRAICSIRLISQCSDTSGECVPV